MPAPFEFIALLFAICHPPSELIPGPSFEYGTFLLSQGRGANFCLENRRRFPPTSTYDKSALSI